jgi:fatty acid desaturase
MEEKQTDTRNELTLLGKSLPDIYYKYLQSFLTWVTGKSYSGQKALFISSKKYELATAIASLLGGATASAVIFNSSPFLILLLPISWIVTVGGARKILTCIIHRCVHRQFCGNKGDRLLAEILSTPLLLQGYDSYKHDHVTCHHHVDKFATFEGDPDAKFMLALGFYPGLENGRS